ncbi:MAG: leucyl aminopeptidase [Aquabacterium sp.]|uniref:leucyl aminopeptidase n=1 Tax=Aquabacterium sp. TaxID=1872578 RepID=UPI001221DE84|nr:leucyl aminopeptidase [Aquabacterium sp.]TAK97152.1 MAG: leucyl aminopeptidase [Aquabacterium sp.]
MDYRSTVAEGPALSQVNADALLLVLTSDQAVTGDAVLDKLIKDAVAADDFALKAGRALYIHRPAGVKAARLVLLAAADAKPKSYKAAVVKGLAQVKELGAAHVAVASGKGLALSADHAKALALGVADATYVYRHTKPSASKAGALKKVTVVSTQADAAAVKAGLAQGQAVAEGVALGRELGNLPGNYCTPTHLGNEAKRLSREFKHIKAEVLDRRAIEKLGMGSFLSVSNGSAQPPRFIILRYQGAAASQAPVVLVGKGITFDTGGISIKPGAGMDEMKFDMGGAASVLGTFRAVAELKPKINLVGLIPTCENMPSGSSTKPGDVVTSMSGQTIEVLNTDAEGRLILCDALTYAERFKPAAVVDIATLTGACVVALGNVHSGLFSADEQLAGALLEAGQQSLDTAWRMPLDEEYGESLKSNFADLGNVGGREGGAITAAVFLSKFTKAYRWAHLDIAGSAWKSGGAKGGTGRPVGLLTQFILNQAAAGKDAIAPQLAKTAKAQGKATAGKTARKVAGKTARKAPARKAAAKA